MAPLSFEAASIPRFPNTANEQRLIDALCFERTFWSAVQEFLTANTGGPRSGGVLEVCLVSDESRQIKLVVNVRNVAASSPTADSIRSGLPPDYGWQVSDYFFSKRPTPTSWYLSHIERRLTFVDLPWRRIETLGNLKLSASSILTRPDSRKLLTGTVDEDAYETVRYCVPITGALEIDPRSLKALLLELQSEGPCVVSLAMSAADAGRLDKYGRVAMFWNGHLRGFASGIANAGFANVAAVSQQFDRFLLPNRFFVLANWSVAAPTADRARSIALHLSARLGGLRTFGILDPVRIRHAENDTAVVDPWLYDPYRFTWSERWLTSGYGRLQKTLQSDGVTVDGNVEKDIVRFTLELPHLYTIDEIAKVAALPLADEEGLPGLETRLIPPFCEPSRSPKADDSKLRQYLRVGVARARDLNGSSESTGGALASSDWHRIPIDDLTKHAFIVGSTGSGKTVTTLFLVRELADLKIPFLIIEPVKTEYFDALREIPALDVKRYRLEGTAAGEAAGDFLSFDPMRLQDGVSVARHASYLKSCFEAAFPMPENSPESMILEAGIREYYTTSLEKYGCGLNMFTRGGPSVHRADVHVHFEQTTSDADGKPVVKKIHKTTSFGRPYTLKANEKPIPGFKDEVFVSPSLRGFRKFLFSTFLPKMVLQRTQGSKNLTELLETWRQFFERRFEALMSGMIGFASVKADTAFLKDIESQKSGGLDSSIRYDPFSELLKGPTVLELDGIPDDQQKALMMAFVTSFLFEKRQAEDLARREADEIRRASGGHNPNVPVESGHLRHVLIVEEAHRMLTNPNHSVARANNGGAQSKSVSVFVDMLAEIRAFGQGMIIVEQIPTKIVPEAVKNTNLKIMLRLTAADDREFLGAAMNFTEEQKSFVTSLKAEPGRGVDFVVFEQQLDQPRLLMLPLPSKKEQPIHGGLFHREDVVS